MIFSREKIRGYSTYSINFSPNGDDDDPPRTTANKTRNPIASSGSVNHPPGLELRPACALALSSSHIYISLESVLRPCLGVFPKRFNIWTVPNIILLNASGTANSNETIAGATVHVKKGMTSKIDAPAAVEQRQQQQLSTPTKHDPKPTPKASNATPKKINFVTPDRSGASQQQQQQQQLSASSGADGCILRSKRMRPQRSSSSSSSSYPPHRPSPVCWMQSTNERNCSCVCPRRRTRNSRINWSMTSSGVTTRVAFRWRRSSC